MVRTLNDGTTAIQSFRAVADREISTAVGELNNLLADLEKANNAVIAGTRSGRDVSDALDQRDATLKKIAEYVPISTFTRGDNDMVVLTKDGSTLFEAVPRNVSFTPTGVYSSRHDRAGRSSSTACRSISPPAATPARRAASPA